MLTPGFAINEQNASETALINSALNLFILHNEQKINVTQLIKSAGLSKTIFYKYFANKEDVYAAIFLTDEFSIGPLLKKMRVYGTVSDLLEEYLRYRIQHIDKYRVISRLEKHLQTNDSQLERYKQWQLLRRNNVDEFTSIVESKLSRVKQVDQENLRFYYGLVWSIATGVSQLSESDFFHELILDRRGFTRFLLESVTKIGEIK